ncbi:hypothetical protein A5658_13605 [Mycobacterium sp. 1245111.1]|nr:hypothetical protein A5658_13605 [Mycobacterium sp. 1245111.1]
MALAATMGLIASVVMAPPAAADPCSPAASAAATNNGRALPGAATPPPEHMPTGRMPRGAQTQAMPPGLGPLPAAASDSAAPGALNFAPMQQQGAVLPPPAPGLPGPAGQQVPNPMGLTTGAPAAAVAAPTTTIVSWIDGPNSPNNTYARFAISGADLGIMWDNGQTGANDQVLIAFGDTFGNCSVAGQQWRSNTLFRSADHNLADGVSVPDPAFGNVYAGSPVLSATPPGSNFSRQIIASLNLAPTEVTIIPTAGISVGTTQYVNFMSVRQWGNPGQWTTNFSAIAVSTDNGETWTAGRETVRPSFFFSVPSVWFNWGNQNFQQGAFVRRDGYLYSFGTPSGRSGSAYVSRVPENAVLDLSQYQYWSQPWWNFFGTGSWVTNSPWAATPVISAPVSEMSVQYNDYLNKYIVLYTDGSNSVVMRTSDNPQGPWSTAQTLVTSTQLPGGIYAPFIHPWSTGRDLYFNLSLWSTYSVMLMHTTLP